MIYLGIAFLFVSFWGACAGAQEIKFKETDILVLDDFEGDIVAGPSGTIDVGSGKGASVEVSGDKADKMSGGQSLKITYEAVPGGYIRVARGYGLDVKGAARWMIEPDKVAWSNYGAVSFFFRGTASGAKIAFDIKDAQDEMFRFMVTDDSSAWKPVICPFDQFVARGGEQPALAAANATLDFPIKSFQWEPIAVAKGTIHVDEVILESLN
jgi:hypothetical protein